MPFALIGFSLGLMAIPASVTNGWHTTFTPQYLILLFILVILCMVFARSAAMAFNRYLDRSFDAKNPRTAIREIPKGIISANSALRFVLLSSIAFVVCTFFINRLCFFLSPIALLVVLGYSYTKRFTALCHIILG